MTFPHIFHIFQEMNMATVTRFCFSLVLLLLSAGFTVAARAADDIQAAGAVIVEDANLRTSPAENAKIITPLRKETKVLAKDRYKEWVKVEVPGLAVSGWVHSSLLKENPAVQLAPTDKKKTIEADQQKITRKNSPKEKKPDRPMQSIGVIDIQQVVDQSLRGRQARERFEEMRRAGETERIDGVEKEMISHVITEIQTIVEKYAVDNGFTHVLNRNSGSIFYNDASFDITNDIIREYDRQASRQQPAP